MANSVTLQFEIEGTITGLGTHKMEAYHNAELFTITFYNTENGVVDNKDTAGHFHLPKGDARALRNHLNAFLDEV